MSQSWPEVELREVCDSIVDCVNKTAPVVEAPTPYRMIRTTNVKAGKIDLETVRYVTEDTYKVWTRRQVPKPGDVILTREAPLGEVGMLRECDGVFLGQRLMSYRANPAKLNPHFLLYALQEDHLQGQIHSTGSGATVQHMRVPDAERLKVRLPPLSTQRKIALILSAYDDLIENNARRVRVLEDMARALYREWFVEYRFPGHEQAEFVEDEQGRRPAGWERLEMGQVCTRVTDGAHKSPPSQTEGLPMASVKDMHDWGINLSTCRLISEADFVELVRNDCKPRLGDVLIAKDGSYLKHTFVVEEEQDVVLLSSIAMLRPNQQRISPFYLALHLRQNEVKQRLKGYVSGVAIPRIVLKDFRKFLILVPDMATQSEFERLTQPLRAQVLNLLNRNANLRRTRDLLLPRLVSGELDVSELGIVGVEEGQGVNEEVVA